MSGSDIKVTSNVRTLDGKRIQNMVYSKHLNKIIATDLDDKSLKIFDIDGSSNVRTERVNDVLIKPVAICLNKDNDIFVADWYHKVIIVFDKEFKYLRKIGENMIETPVHMEIDNDCNTIYITDRYNNYLLLINSINGNYINKVDLESPTCIKINNKNNRIYVVGSSKWNYNNKTQNNNNNNNDDDDGIKVYVNGITGPNCIYVLDKSNLKLINKLTYNDWLGVDGLYLTPFNSHIVTTAFKYDKLNSKISDTRHIYMIKDENECKSYVLNDVRTFIDMIIVNNSLVLSYKNLIKTISPNFNE